MSSYKDRKDEIEKLKNLMEDLFWELDDLMTLNAMVIETYKLKELLKKYKKEYFKR